MRKTILTLSAVAALAAPAIASAQSAPAAAPQSPHTLTGNLGLVSDYRFRGISQTFGLPALQGGFDYSHSSGFYAGNWNSSISETAGFPNGHLEMDFYTGYKTSTGAVAWDVGYIYYYYPGSNAAGNANYVVVNPSSGTVGSGFVKNQEVYLGATWKFLSFKAYRSLSDYFSVPSTAGTWYFDLTATYDMGNGWGIVGHGGRVRTNDAAGVSYNDYKLGVTKDINGWVWGLAWIGTTAAMEGSCAGGTAMFYHFCKADTAGAASKDYKGGKDTLVLSLVKSF